MTMHTRRALALVALTGCMIPPQQQGTSSGGQAAVGASRAGGRLVVEYDDSPNRYREALREEAVFDRVSDAVSTVLALPRDVRVAFTACGTINAYYDPDKHAIYMCDEIIQYFASAIEAGGGGQAEQRKAILGALLFFYLHEVGHALVHELDLPAVGREEDAADQLAALLLLSAGEGGAELAGYGADAFIHVLRLRGGQSAPFWDEHSLDEQRFYNVACLIYGSNPQAYGIVVERGFLPEARARRCPREFQNVNQAWEKLLAPHVRK